jgi:integrase
MLDMGKRRQYKSGSVREKSGRFYVRWYDFEGERHEEAAGTDRRAAERLLQQRIGENAAGGKRVSKAGVDITVKDCLEVALAEMRQRKLASYQISKWKVDSILVPAVGWMRAASFGWKDAWKYIDSRRAGEVKDSTINRELSLLRKAFKLAAGPNHQMIAAAPPLPTLDEGDNVRTGFLTPNEYDRVLAALPEYLRPLLCVAYNTGLRRGTLLSIRLDQVDLAAGLIWISRTQVKNRQGQTVPIMAGAMRGYCEMAVSANKRYLFERDGRQIRDFRAAWSAACTAAELPNLLFHDLRRTSARDWVAAGASESATMAITGHKTRSMFDRYNIIQSATVLRAAALKTAFDEQSLKTRKKLGEERGKADSAKPS